MKQGLQTMICVVTLSTGKPAVVIPDIKPLPPSAMQGASPTFVLLPSLSSNPNVDELIAFASEASVCQVL